MVEIWEDSIAAGQEHNFRIESAIQNITQHVADLENPHELTPAQIGAAAGDASGNAQNSLKLGGQPPEAYIQPQPNLLDNWYFAAAINQRGQSKYGIGYGIDRWSLSNFGDGAEETLHSDGLMLTFGNSGGVINQVVELSVFEQLSGKTITLSSFYKSNATLWNSLYFGYFKDNTWHTVAETSLPASSTWNVGVLTATIPKEITNITRFELFVTGCSNGSMTIKAAKVELGNYQTLAHQDENGDWMLLEPPPNPALELLKCQRYFEIGNTWKLYNCTKPNVLPGVDFVVPKRVTPHVTALSHFGENTVTAWGGQVSINVTVVDVSSPLGINSIVADGLVAGEAYHYGYIADAEIY